MTPDGEGFDSTRNHDSGDGPQNVTNADLRRSITPSFSRNESGDSLQIVANADLRRSITPSFSRNESGDSPQNVANADLRRSITPSFSRNNSPYLELDRDSPCKSSIMSVSSRMRCRICCNCRPIHKRTFLLPLLYGLVAACIAYAIFQFLIVDLGSQYNQDEIFRIRRTIEDLTNAFHYTEKFGKKMQSDLKMVIEHLPKMSIFTDSTPAGANPDNQIVRSELNDNAGMNLENPDDGQNYIQNELNGNAHAKVGNLKYGHYAGTNPQKEKDDQNHAGVNIQNKKDDSTNLQKQVDDESYVGTNPQNEIYDQNYAGPNLQNKKDSQNFDRINLPITKEDSMNLQNQNNGQNNAVINLQNENDGQTYTGSSLQNMKDSQNHDGTNIQNKKDAGKNLQNQEDGQNYVDINLQNENYGQKYSCMNLHNKKDPGKKHQNQNYVDTNFQNEKNGQNDVLNIQKQEDSQNYAATNLQNKNDSQTYDGTNIQNKKDDSKTLQNQKDRQNYDAMNIPKQENGQNYVTTGLQNQNDQNIVDTNRQNQRADQNYASTKLENQEDRNELSSVSSSNLQNRKDLQNYIRNELSSYDGDNTLRADFASETTGGRVVAIGNTVPFYNYENKLSQILSMILIAICGPKYAAQGILQPSLHPGQCWAFSGSHGEVIIRLNGKVYCNGVTIEHIPAAISPTGETTSAPKDFTVKGLETVKDKTGCSFGSFTYDQNGVPNQYFQVENNCGKPYRYIKISFLTNWGNPVFTCIYRVQVHGKLVEGYDGEI